MKITNATIKRINKHSDITKDSYIYLIDLIANLLCRANVILEDRKGYIFNDDDFLINHGYAPIISNKGDEKHECIVSEISGDYERKYIRGMQSKYPLFIQGILTLGNTEVDIYDVNKLVRAIINECENNPTR